MKIEKTETFVEHDIIVSDTQVGTVELCPERNEISRLVIFEPYQNKGYGTEVVRELMAQGYKSLWVRSDNPRAIHVYKKCGFKRGRTHMFEMTDGLQSYSEYMYHEKEDSPYDDCGHYYGWKEVDEWTDEEIEEKAKQIPWEDVIAVRVGVN